ncbi:alpha/beta hydrolase [Granulicella sibirica]|uniref:Bem46 protein n=1 Tax=Granulicella sibirica TaxID=2479048 RepID=A0A4Q0T3I5_9BACT|nr:alpha/beta fold hydrolase [Granulicella sibirica]RXH56096.1 Bem46 protein [Granulicella sibirica]
MPRPKTTRTTAPQPTPKAASTPETVDPIWILKALGFTIVAALVCGYLTLCLLFYQGQWQLILHPQRSNSPLDTLGGLPAEPVHFDAAETGSPRLSGAYLAAAPNSKYAGYTVLYLRSGDASLSQSAPDAGNLAVLHGLGLSIFAFDYRGYGQSDPTHPNQIRMLEDAHAALLWTENSRHVPADHLILFGHGLGASLAVQLASSDPKIPALILDSLGPDPIGTAMADPRTRALPVRALFHEDFPLGGLSGLRTPKLLISYPTPSSPIPPTYKTAADPKTTLELVSNDPGSLPQGIARFLDQSLAQAPSSLTAPQQSR